MTVRVTTQCVSPRACRMAKFRCEGRLPSWRIGARTPAWRNWLTMRETVSSFNAVMSAMSCRDGRTTCSSTAVLVGCSAAGCASNLTCLLYPPDAAAERSGVEFGGGGIIKKKKVKQ